VSGSEVSSSSVGRRGFLKIAVSAIVAGVVAGVGGYFAGSATVPPPKTVTETVTKTVATTITQTKTVTVTSTPKPTKPTKPTRKILIAAGRTPDPWYPFAAALAKFINKKSDWLRAEAVSTAGVTANTEVMREKPKEYIAIGCLSQIHWLPGHPWGEARGTYTGGRFIANATSMTQCFVTYNPDLKKVEDLAGKVVDVGRKGATNTIDHKAILEAYGILDKVKLVYTGYGGGAKKLRDGLVDTTMLIFVHIYPHKFSKGSFIEQLETKAPVYYIGFDRDILLELCEKEYATLPVRVPAGALGKTQPNELWAYNDATFFWADESLEEDVVYEITRIIWETPAEEWAKWHPMGAHMNEKFKPAVPLPKVFKPHPGARKFYEEHGIEIKNLADLLA